LGIDTSTIRYLSHSAKAVNRGRPPLLDKANEVFARVHETDARGTLWTVRDIARYIVTKWNLSIDKSTLWHLLMRHPRVTNYAGIPMEQKCLELSPEEPFGHILHLIGFVEEISFRFVSFCSISLSILTKCATKIGQTDNRKYVSSLLLIKNIESTPRYRGRETG
jgi:hypothetical protein